MNRKITKNLIGFISFIFCVFVFSQSVYALNGIKPLGFGARYTGMAGVSTGVGGSIADLENNTAHLADLKRPTLDINASFLLPTIVYESSFADTDPDLAYSSKVTDHPTTPVTLPFIGYMTPIGDKMGFGVALYAQGGIAAELKGITRTTPTGATVNSTIDALMGSGSANLPAVGNSKKIQESTYTELAYAKITPALAIKLGKLNLGIGLDFGAATLEYRLTAQDPTGSVDLPGAGYRYKSDVAYTFSGKFGATYQATETLKLGYSYRARSRMYLDGTMSINASNPTFYHANGVSFNLDFPEMHSVGLSIKLGKLLLAFDVDYIQWSGAITTLDFYTDETWVFNPLGFFLGELVFTVNWRDQAVYKAGLEYDLSEKLVLRTGYSYARSAVDGVGSNPVFPAINRNHVSAGIGVKGDNWGLDFSLEYSLPNRVAGSNTGDYILLHAIFSSSDIRVANMNQATKLSVLTPSIGFKYMF